MTINFKSRRDGVTIYGFDDQHAMGLIERSVSGLSRRLELPRMLKAEARGGPRRQDCLGNKRQGMIPTGTTIRLRTACNRPLSTR